MEGHEILPVRLIHPPAPRHGFNDVNHSESLTGSAYFRVAADFLSFRGCVVEADKHICEYGISTQAYSVFYHSQRRCASFVETQHRRFAPLVRPVQAQNDPYAPSSK
jgi:hypothetical protein